MNLTFDPAQFIVDYPAFNGFSANALNNYYNEFALVLGSRFLSLFNNVLPVATWNATTNTPALANGSANSYLSYLCTTPGTVNFGAGSIVFVNYNVVSYNTYSQTWGNIGYPARYNWSCVVLAHILTLLGLPGSGGSLQVGKVTSAAEGSVSGSFGMMDTTNATWWNQTAYGAMCWEMIKQRGGFTYFNLPNYNGYVADSAPCAWGGYYS